MTHPPRGPGKELPTGGRDLGIHPTYPSILQNAVAYLLSSLYLVGY